MASEVVGQHLHKLLGATSRANARPDYAEWHATGCRTATICTSCLSLGTFCAGECKGLNAISFARALQKELREDQGISKVEDFLVEILGSSAWKGSFGAACQMDERF